MPMQVLNSSNIGDDPLFLNILVVDDEVNIRKTISYCLSSLGHEVTAAATAKESLEVIRRQKIHLVFLDLRLEETNGMDLILLLEQENASIKKEIEDIQPAYQWESTNQKYRNMLSTLEKAASSDATILLQGESGTGKSMV